MKAIAAKAINVIINKIPDECVYSDSFILVHLNSEHKRFIFMIFPFVCLIQLLRLAEFGGSVTEEAC